MSEQSNGIQGTGSEEQAEGDGTSSRSYGRRALMLGAATAGVGAAASLVAGADPAAAANGSAVLLGESNKASATTIIKNKSGIALAGFTSDSGQSGVLGADTSSGGAYGLYGLSDNGTGVYGSIGGDTSGQSGIQGVDDSSGGGYGVYGNATGGRCNGVYGTSPATESAGVSGYASGGGGVGVSGSASGENGRGVIGTADGTGYSYGVYAANFSDSADSEALYVDGTSTFTGTISKPGGSFKIDHPVDPENKYLYHSFVESPDMMNVYNGTVVLGGDGRATVELPGWFEALNSDYRYQLTPIGCFAPLYISKEITRGKFEIAGGLLDQKVSWQVTGIRQDAWANANRIPVEVDKKSADRGRYLHPELFGGGTITALAQARDRVRRHHLNSPTNR